MSFLDKITPKTEPVTMEDIYARVVGQPKDHEDGFLFTLRAIPAPMREVIGQRYSGAVFLTNQDNTTGVEKADLLFLRGGAGFEFSQAVHQYRVEHAHRHPPGAARKFLQSIAAATSFSKVPAESFAGLFSNGNRAMPLEQLLGNTMGFNVREGRNKATIIDLTLRDTPRVMDALEIFKGKYDSHEVKLGEHTKALMNEEKTPVLHLQLFGAAAEVYNEQYQAYQRDVQRREKKDIPAR